MKVLFVNKAIILTQNKYVQNIEQKLHKEPQVLRQLNDRKKE